MIISIAVESLVMLVSSLLMLVFSVFSLFLPCLALVEFYQFYCFQNSNQLLVLLIFPYCISVFYLIVYNFNFYYFTSSAYFISLAFLVFEMSAEVTDSRPFFFSNIDVQCHKFPLKYCLSVIPQILISDVFIFLQFSILSNFLFISSLTHGVYRIMLFNLQTQVYLGDIVGLVPDYGNKANIPTEQVK